MIHELSIIAHMHSGLILLVENQRTGHVSWSSAIERAGFNLIVVNNGRKALAALGQNRVDVMVFDTIAMRSNGVRICRLVRRQSPNIIIIHCRDENKPIDLDIEADEYLAMPFTARKLLNRIRALMPPKDRPDQIIKLGHVTLYTGKGSVFIEGKGEVILTPKKLGLLKLFMTRPNTIITRPELMLDVWHTHYVGDTRTLDVHIRWVREIIENDPSQPQYLQTVRGQGYILKL